MSKGTTLVKRTAIYAVGNLGSKILAYAMVLIYTYFISPEELGYYDVVITTVSMLQPLILFQINDGVYRYLVDSDIQIQRGIISNGIQFLCLTTIASEVVFFCVSRFYSIEYIVWVALLLATTPCFALFQDIVRGLGESKFYATIGLLNSFIMLICEAVGLVGFRLGVEALLASKVIANLACILLVYIKQPEVKSALRIRFQKKIIFPLIKYSAPLVPNTICWWVVNSSDRYIILFFLGTAFNGIYSMATKFPTILTTITSIFYLAWQESAIKEYNSENRDEFFSKIFKKYYVLLLTLCICAFPATRFVIEIFVSEDYKIAWRYTGFLYLGAVFSALCSFLGLGYQISRETFRSFWSTVLAAFINAGINILTIRWIGLHAASFSTFVAYVFLLIVRVQHTKRYFKLKIDWKQFMLLLGATFFMLLVTTFVQNIWFCIPLEIIAIIILLLMNRTLIRPVIEKFVNR